MKLPTLRHHRLSPENTVNKNGGRERKEGEDGGRRGVRERGRVVSHAVSQPPPSSVFLIVDFRLPCRYRVLWFGREESRRRLRYALPLFTSAVVCVDCRAHRAVLVLLSRASTSGME